MAKKKEADKIRHCKGCDTTFTYRRETGRPDYDKIYCSVDCMKKNNKTGGRPSKMDAEKLKKLEEAFALDCSIGEACFYAEISQATYHNWVNANPNLLERFNALREKPVLIARQTVVKGLKDDKELALKYLERKRKNEFSTKQEVDQMNKNIDIEKILTEKQQKALDALLDLYK